MDEADYAQIHEEQERLAGVLRVVERNRQSPLVVNGVRICLTCKESIPQERIDAAHSAVRCADCQDIFEQYQQKVE